MFLFCFCAFVAVASGYAFYCLWRAYQLRKEYEALQAEFEHEKLRFRLWCIAEGIDVGRI